MTTLEDLQEQLRNMHEAAGKQQDAYARMFSQWQAGTLSDEDLYQQAFGTGAPKQQAYYNQNPFFGQQGGPSPYHQAQHRARQAAPAPTLDPIKRKQEIDAELDIIRGRVPTPAGYTIDPARVKLLLKERKTLGT